MRKKIIIAVKGQLLKQPCVTFLVHDAIIDSKNYDCSELLSHIKFLLYM